MASTIHKPPIDARQPPVHPSAVCITQETINRDLEDLDILVRRWTSDGSDRNAELPCAIDRPDCGA
jgi:hypothetical protein